MAKVLHQSNEQKHFKQSVSSKVGRVPRPEKIALPKSVVVSDLSYEAKCARVCLYVCMFVCMWQQGLWQVLRNYGIPEELVELLEDMYSKSLSAVRVDGELTEWFRVTVGVRQGCRLSPYLFNLILEAMMSFASKSTEAGARVGGQTVNNLKFVDDIDLVAEDDGQLQELMDEVCSSSQRFGLKINVEKTKTMTIGKQQKTVEIKIEGETLEQVTEFIYL